MPPLSILHDLVVITVLLQNIVLILFYLKRQKWTAVLQMSLAVITLALVSSEILFFGRFDFKVIAVLTIQGIIACAFWFILKRVANN